MNASPVPDARRARVRVGVGATVVLGLLAVGIAVLVTALSPHGSSAVVAPGTSAAPTASSLDAAAGPVIYVHILGQVARPGLYALHDGDRGVDIVAAAGGFTPEADPTSINLARFLSDGEKIVVPAIGEAPPATTGASAGGAVNLNTADATALETLPRIGPAMAQRILDWRETNGRFTAIEDLLDVPGIGDATFDGLRELVTV
ncbi:MAG: ComEA family DNA-binding protein [Pseudolysinimonas sp.]